MNIKILSVLIFMLPLSAESLQSETEFVKNDELFKVYKTSTCGCCKEWINHAVKNGFNITSKDYQNLDEVKQKYGIQPQYRSCHTTVSSNGFIFEGHIPSKYIDQFLSESHPDAIGLSVPGMPLGSPGMEVGNRFTPYNVLILFKDGSSKIYAKVNKK